MVETILEETCPSNQQRNEEQKCNASIEPCLGVSLVFRNLASKTPHPQSRRQWSDDVSLLTDVDIH